MLNLKAFALACAWLSAIYTLVLHVYVWLTGKGTALLELVLELHPGASTSPIGTAVHIVEMFVYGLVGGWLFALLYNKLSKSKAE